MDLDQHSSFRGYLLYRHLAHTGIRAAFFALQLLIVAGYGFGVASLLCNGGNPGGLIAIGVFFTVLSAFQYCLERSAAKDQKSVTAALRFLDGQLALPNVKGAGSHVLRTFETGVPGTGEMKPAEAADLFGVAKWFYLCGCVCGVVTCLLPYWVHPIKVVEPVVFGGRGNGQKEILQGGTPYISRPLGVLPPGVSATKSISRPAPGSTPFGQPVHPKLTPSPIISGPVIATPSPRGTAMPPSLPAGVSNPESLSITPAPSKLRVPPSAGRQISP